MRNNDNPTFTFDNPTFTFDNPTFTFEHNSKLSLELRPLTTFITTARLVRPPASMIPLKPTMQQIASPFTLDLKK
jgi:hypothetical protein